MNNVMTMVADRQSKSALRRARRRFLVRGERDKAAAITEALRDDDVWEFVNAKMMFDFAVSEGQESTPLLDFFKWLIEGETLRKFFEWVLENADAIVAFIQMIIGLFAQTEA